MKKNSIENTKKYEISFLLTDPVAEVSIAHLLEQYRAKITVKPVIKDIKLAYPIKKHSVAFFGFVQFEAVAEDVLKISQALKLNASILRFLVVKPSLIKERKKEKVIEDSIDIAKEEKKQSKENKTAALTNEALEEKLEEILK